MITSTQDTSAATTTTPGWSDEPADLRRALPSLQVGIDVQRTVRAEIRESWQRSAAAGVTPHGVDIPFDHDLDADGLLVRAARPVMDQLVVDLIEARMSVVLADALGHVLDRRVPDAGLKARLDRIFLAPGFIYAEDVLGTNGIGTALAQRRPAFVEGDEHYVDALTTMACAGAPISDPRSGRILGVIGLACVKDDASGLMLPFAQRAAREIEQFLVDLAGVSDRLLLQRFLRERRRVKGPIVFITDDGIITNSAADRLVDPVDEQVLLECASRLLRGEQGDTARVVLLGGAVTVRWEPLLDSGSGGGTMLRLEPVSDTDTAASSSRYERGHRTFGWDSLTGTERSVTELVAHGLTNREVAERLFMSRHTVGYHLRSIFRKLDVRSRVDLTRIALQRDPVGGEVEAVELRRA
ncbi:MAG: putative transcriptional regulator [Solirubrobacterales bacterium]|nr:putative transcriptional regulator [Solirubrobacterales bacterium]